MIFVLFMQLLAVSSHAGLTGNDFDQGRLMPRAVLGAARAAASKMEALPGRSVAQPVSAQSEEKGVLPAALKKYARPLVLSYPDADGTGVAFRATIMVVPVHPNIAIHFFVPNEENMFLNHGKDKAGVRYYNSILYPLWGMKSYVVPDATLTGVAPAKLLDAQAKDILDLQISEIARYGGLQNYKKLIELRGWFEP